jgi:hypothetical protein
MSALPQRADMLSAWGALLTQHQKVHRLSGKTLPVRIAGIELSLLDCVPTKNRHELMGSRSIFGGDGCARFAQSVGGAVRQPLPDRTNLAFCFRSHWQ